MRYCFRHSDANWYATLWVLLALFAGITAWVIAAGVRYAPSQTPLAQAPAQVTVTEDQAASPGSLQVAQQGAAPRTGTSQVQNA